MKLSVCLIVRNEERVLARCLQCAAAIADDLVVVDTGSSDRSVEIAHGYTDRVYLHAWRNSFAEARNYAASLAACDYVMWLDADDVIEETDIAAINSLKEGLPPDTDVVFLTYANGNGYFHDYVLRDRILRKEYSALNVGDAHENIPIQPEWKRLLRPDIRIVHQKEYVNDPDRNINIFNRFLEAGKVMDDHDRVYYCRELWAHGYYDAAREEFQKLKPEAMRPELYYYALVFAVKALQDAGSYAECARLIRDALAYIEPTAYMVCQLADSLERIGDREGARACYLQALHLPERPESFCIQFTGYTEYVPCVRLARLYYSDGDRIAARQYNDRARAAYPRGSEWLMNRILMADTSAE